MDLLKLNLANMTIPLTDPLGRFRCDFCFRLAFWGGLAQVVAMPHRTKKAKKSETKPGELGNDLSRAAQLSEQRRRDLATRSTLSRLRNRKSALK
jgi:hypothetical protein